MNFPPRKNVQFLCIYIYKETCIYMQRNCKETAHFLTVENSFHAHYTYIYIYVYSVSDSLYEFFHICTQTCKYVNSELLCYLTFIDQLQSDGLYVYASAATPGNIIRLILVNHQTKTRMETEHGQNSCEQNINQAIQDSFNFKIEIYVIYNI